MPGTAERPKTAKVRKSPTKVQSPKRTIVKSSPKRVKAEVKTSPTRVKVEAKTSPKRVKAEAKASPKRVKAEAKASPKRVKTEVKGGSVPEKKLSKLSNRNTDKRPRVKDPEYLLQRADESGHAGMVASILT